MKKFFLSLFFLILINSFTFAADRKLNIHSDTYTVAADYRWSDINNVYIFRPLKTTNSIYFFIANKNPTNSHSLNFQVYQTPSSTVNDYTNNSGLWVQDVVNGNCNIVNSSSMSSCWVNTLFASQVAVKISSATTQAGTPDTLDFYIVQGQGEPKGQGLGQFTNPDSYSPYNNLQSVGYLAFSGVITDPAATASFLRIGETTTKDLYLDHIVISASADVIVELHHSSDITSDSGCTTINPIQTKITGLLILDTITVNRSCTTESNITKIGQFYLAANIAQYIDLSNYYFIKNRDNGLVFRVQSFTGSISATLYWTEQ